MRLLAILPLKVLIIVLILKHINFKLPGMCNLQKINFHTHLWSHHHHQAAIVLMRVFFYFFQPLVAFLIDECCLISVLIILQSLYPPSITSPHMISTHLCVLLHPTLLVKPLHPSLLLLLHFYHLVILHYSLVPLLLGSKIIFGSPLTN